MKQKISEIIKQNPNFSIKLNMRSGKEIVLKSDFHKLKFGEDKRFLSVTGPNHNYFIRYDDIESIDYIE